MRCATTLALRASGNGPIQPLPAPRPACWAFVLPDRAVASQLAPRTRGAIWTAAWYHKQQLTFADALAAVRREIWKTQGLSISRKIPDMQKLPQRLQDGITQALCYAA